MIFRDWAMTLTECFEKNAVCFEKKAVCFLLFRITFASLSFPEQHAKPASVHMRHAKRRQADA